MRYDDEKFVQFSLLFSMSQHTHTRNRLTCTPLTPRIHFNFVDLFRERSRASGWCFWIDLWIQLIACKLIDRLTRARLGFEWIKSKLFIIIIIISRTKVLSEWEEKSNFTKIENKQSRVFQDERLRAHSTAKNTFSNKICVNKIDFWGEWDAKRTAK